MHAAKDLVERKLVIPVVLPTVFCVLVLEGACWLAAWMEFRHGYWATTEADLLPPFTVLYRQLYPYGLAWPALAITWGSLAVARKHCTLLNLVLYVGTFCVFLTFWLSATLLALYFGNQSFVIPRL